MPIGIGTATAIAAGAGAAASIYGATKQGNAATRAANTTATADAAQLDFLKQQEAERVKEYNAQQAAAQAAWTAEQNRRAPYRQAAQGALLSLSKFAGIPAPSLAVADPNGPPPPGWTPGAATGPVSMASMVPPTSQVDSTTAAALMQPRRVALGLPGGSAY